MSVLRCKRGIQRLAIMYKIIMRWISRLLTCLVLLLASCTSTKYVPVESVKHDSVYLNKIVKDSVYVKDSVLIVKGDTITEYRYKYIYQYKDRTDTLYITKTDTIRVPYPVERPLTRWEQLKDRAGGIVMFVLIITLLIVFGRLVYKLKK